MDKNFPQWRECNGNRLLYVDDAPFLMLGLQWNCDSCFSPAVMDGLFPHAQAMGLNTASLLLYWREVEPEEGVYDFTHLDHRLEMCRKHGLKAVLVWFGAWKNCALGYAPDYIRRDTVAYPRVHTADGRELFEFACPSSSPLHDRDERALKAVFTHLRDTDTQHTVILFQMENEVGIMGSDSCYCPACNAAFSFEREELTGKYGSDHLREAFTARQIARICEAHAAACRAIYPLPIYMNAALMALHQYNDPCRDYMAAGPVTHLLQVYYDTFRNIACVGPDIYQYSCRDFHALCDAYRRPGAPFFIPEHASGRGARAEVNCFYAFGEYGACGFDPWAIDCAFPAMGDPPLVNPADFRWSPEAYALRDSYTAIGNAMVPVAEAMGTERLRVFVQEPGDFGDCFLMGGYLLTLRYVGGEVSRGMLLHTGEGEFILLGVGLSLTIQTPEGQPVMNSSDTGFFKGSRFVVTKPNCITIGSGIPRILCTRGEVLRIRTHRRSVTGEEPAVSPAAGISVPGLEGGL